MTSIKSVFAGIAFTLSGLLYSQEAVLIEDRYDQLTQQWLEVSEYLKTYDGLSTFCTNAEFRTLSLDILHELHHVDSIVLEFLNDPSAEELIGHHEYKQARKAIDQFEGKYSIRAFMAFLRESCLTRNDLEKNKEDLKKEVGMHSYDGQLVVLESSLTKYMKHIEKRIVSIDEHIHRIHPDRFNHLKSFALNE